MREFNTCRDGRRRVVWASTVTSRLLYQARSLDELRHREAIEAYLDEVRMPLRALLISWQSSGPGVTRLPEHWSTMRECT